MSGSVAVSLYTHDKGKTSSVSPTPSHFAPYSDTVGRTAAVVMLSIDIESD
jgi:hypothetical protein